MAQAHLKSKIMGLLSSGSFEVFKEGNDVVSVLAHRFSASKKNVKEAIEE